MQVVNFTLTYTYAFFCSVLSKMIEIGFFFCFFVVVFFLIFFHFFFICVYVSFSPLICISFTHLFHVYLCTPWFWGLTEYFNPCRHGLACPTSLMLLVNGILVLENVQTCSVQGNQCSCTRVTYIQFHVFIWLHDGQSFPCSIL